MDKTPEQLRAEGEALIAAGKSKIAEAKNAEVVSVQAESPAISPHTKLPVEHPESQEVERIHYAMQQSLASATTPAEIEAFLREKEKKADRANEKPLK